jgi:hypothetical protein
MLAQNTLFITANLAQADADENARLKSTYERIAWRPWETLPVDRFLDEPPGDQSPFELQGP